MRVFYILLLFLVTGCTGIPQGITPVENFDSNRYLGKWYEIARMDHSFERGLQQVTAEYSIRKKGGIKVINRGFDTTSKAWDEAEGKAFFVQDNNIGHLKVSFFGPFFGSYVIFELGDDYEYSLVTGNDRSYFWLLSRTPEIDPTLKKTLLNRISTLGFDTQALIFVEHSSE